MVHVQTIPWPNGELRATWSDTALQTLNFHSPSAFDPQTMADEAQPSSALQSRQRALTVALSNYFAGGPLEYPLEFLDWTGVPSFHQQVLRRCVEIPRGQTMTYGQLASAVGSPGAARAVGQAMARNRWPLIVPCHRVVGHAGKLTGYSGLGGTATKQWLLDQERLSSVASCSKRSTASKLTR